MLYSELRVANSREYFSRTVQQQKELLTAFLPRLNPVEGRHDINIALSPEPLGSEGSANFDDYSVCLCDCVCVFVGLGCQPSRAE
eukprot:3205794-Amphidinium_carterae.1